MHLWSGPSVSRMPFMLVPDKPIRTIHIKTFGCQMNVYDSDRMKSVLQNQGFVYEPELRKADVILLNTCSIRDKAEHKVLSLLGELKPLKEKDPKKVIGVTGCVGQRLGRTLLQRIPHLDLVMGPDAVDRVGDIVTSVLNEGRRVLEAKMDADGRAYQQPAIVLAGRPAEYITIMKGCDHFCTYCIVPFVRGREKSRSIAEIITDVRNFVAKGTKEITFLGQNINTYGKGTGETLAQLIEAANEVEGLERIRYVTSHPRDLGMDLISQFGSVEKLCPALHLPFQSGSDPVLKRMSRLYTNAEYRGKIDALRKQCPEIAISGDAIIGFPGETEEDFQKTFEMAKDIGFSLLYMFKYSPRPGTRAFEYGEEVDEKIKNERLKRLQDLSNAYTQTENENCIGTTQKILVEAMDRKNLHFSGRSLQNKMTHILNAGEACVGKVIDVEITAATGSNLRGFYVGAPKEIRQLPFERNFTAQAAVSAPLS